MQDFIKQFYFRLNGKTSFYILSFALAYFLLGLLGLEIQSEQHGVSPWWAPSGLTLAAFYLLGFWLWPGVLIGLVALSIYINIPLSVALVSSLLSILEASVPLFMARHFGFKGDLDTFHDGLIFVAIILCAPIITALFGSLAMYVVFSGEMLPFSAMLTWWLGNSLGMLLLGGTLLSFYAAKKRTSFCDRLNEKIAFILAIIVIFLMAFTQETPLDAALTINLIIPVVFISAIRFGSCAVSLLCLIIVMLMNFLFSYSPHAHDEAIHLDYIFLILVKIWFVAISGVLIAGAFKDKATQARFQWMAFHDDLTGLANRVSIEEDIDRSLTGVRLSDNNVSLLFLDLDHFKPINDQLGHKRGDEILIKVSQVLLSSVRQNDIVSRWGGDEFVILLQQCSPEKAYEISQNILNEIEKLSFVDNRIDYPVSMSIGVASAILGESMLSFVERADAACYSAKHNGKNQSVVA